MSTFRTFYESATGEEQVLKALLRVRKATIDPPIGFVWSDSMKSLTWKAQQAHRGIQLDQDESRVAMRSYQGLTTSQGYFEGSEYFISIRALRGTTPCVYITHPHANLIRIVGRAPKMIEHLHQLSKKANPTEKDHAELKFRKFVLDLGQNHFTTNLSSHIDFGADRYLQTVKDHFELANELVEQRQVPLEQLIDFMGSKGLPRREVLLLKQENDIPVDLSDEDVFHVV